MVPCSALSSLPPSSWRQHAVRGPDTTPKSSTKRSASNSIIEIRANAVAWAIAAVDVETIDRINIRQASLLAMRTGRGGSSRSRPDYLLIDGIDTIDWPCPQQSVHPGRRNQLSRSPQPASWPRCTATALLVELDRQYPGYGLASHKGYCSREHMEALRETWPHPAAPQELEPGGAADAAAGSSTGRWTMCCLCRAA